MAKKHPLMMGITFLSEETGSIPKPCALWETRETIGSYRSALGRPSKASMLLAPDPAVLALLA